MDEGVAVGADGEEVGKGVEMVSVADVAKRVRWWTWMRSQPGSP